MRLYIMRHGETQWNKVRRLQGQTDIPLNEFGRHLAAETAKGLADVCFDTVYTSPLLRARETAEIIAAGHDLAIKEDPRLMEIGFGEYEGVCVSAEGYNAPDPLFGERFWQPECYTAPPGGESFPELIERVNAFVNDLKREYAADSTVLISTHGAVVCGLLNIIFRGKELKYFWDGKVHKNCAVTIADITDEGVSIIVENQVYYNDEVKEW